MGKYLQIVDNLINKIPKYIQDLIKKGFFALMGLVALIAALIAVKNGISDAPPPGVQMAETTKDLYYIEELRMQNAKQKRLVEDVETEYSDQFEQEKDITGFRDLGRDTMGHLIGEKDEMLNLRGKAILPETRTGEAPDNTNNRGSEAEMHPSQGQHTEPSDDLLSPESIQNSVEQTNPPVANQQPETSPLPLQKEDDEKSSLPFLE